jgi:16S rRNA processing protein RimM
VDGAPRRVTLGRIAGVYGVKGWVKVQSYTRPLENLLDYPRWHIAARNENEYEAEVLEARQHGRSLIAQLSGPDGQPIADRDLAAELVGAQIQVAREALPQPEPGSYYWFDLVGLKVESAQGEPLGRVTALTDNGAQDVLVLRDEALERLIPFVPGVTIEKVDLERGVIVANWAPDW